MDFGQILPLLLVENFIILALSCNIGKLVFRSWRAHLLCRNQLGLFYPLRLLPVLESGTLLDWPITLVVHIDRSFYFQILAALANLSR